jgi:hypothetical protein
VSAVTPEATAAATAVLLRGGTVRDMLEAAAPWMAVAGPGGDGAVRPQDGPRTAGQPPAGVTGYREP